MFHGVLFQGHYPVVWVEMNWDGAVFSVEMRKDNELGELIDSQTPSSFAGESKEISKIVVNNM